MVICCPFAAIGNAAEKESIPFTGALQESARLSQSVGIDALKEDIVLKDEDISSLL